MTATKLNQVRKYVEGMSPIFRAALYEGPERQAEYYGWDSAMAKAQKDLLAILDGPDD